MNFPLFVSLAVNGIAMGMIYALLGMGLISAWACMIAHNLLLFVLFTIHYLRGKWNPLNA